MSAKRGNVRVVVTGDASDLDRELGRSEGRLGKYGPLAKKAMLGVGAAAIGGTIMAVKAFADYDDAMVKSLAIMGDVSAKQKGEMSDVARAVGRDTAFSAKEAAEGYFFLASAGLDAARSMRSLPVVAKFAQAGNFELAQATEYVADAQSALGLSSQNASKHLRETQRVTDVLVKGNIIANAEVDQLAESLTNKAGAAARLLGKDVEETVAVLAAFAAQGVKGQVAGNALNIVWRDLQKATLENKAAFSEQGVAVFDSNGEMRNTADIIGELEKALSSMSDEEKKATLKKLGFREESQAMILTLLGTSNAIRKYEKELHKAGGTSDEVARKQLKGLSGAWIKLKGQGEDLLLSVGAAAAPALEKAALATAGFIDEFQRGVGAGGQFRDTLTSVGNVLGPIISGAANVAAAVGSMGFGLLQTRAGMVLLGAAAGALVGRMAALGVAWGISKIMGAATAIKGFIATLGVLRAVYVAQTGITNASTTAILRHAIATRVAAVGYRGLSAAIASTGIGALIVLAGTAVGALMGMDAATDDTTDSTRDLRDALRGQADAMREVRDIDIDVAQRKVNLASANNSLTRAQRQVNSLVKNGQKGTLAYREALVNLKNAKIEQKRASRDLSRAEADSNRKRSDGVAASKKARQAAREEIRETRDLISRIEEYTDASDRSQEGNRALLRLKVQLARAEQKAAQSGANLNKMQLEQAKASGASKDKIHALKGSIKNFGDESRKADRKVKGLRDEIAELKSKKVKVDVDLNLMMPGGSVFPGGGGSGSGWPLSKAVQSGAQQMADKDPMAFFNAAGGGMGAASGSLAGMVPIAGRFGLSETSGYRPGDDGYHGINRAKDFSNGGGPTPEMMAFAKFVAAAFGAQLLELIYTPLGWSIKNGQRVAPYAQADHFDHVHVAMAHGGKLTRPSVVLAGEEAPSHPEFFISTNPRDKERSMMLLYQAAQALGAPGFAKGGSWGSLVGSSWDNNELATLAHLVGMSNPGLMAQYAQGESGGNASAVNQNTDGSTDTGLWQINSVHGFKGNLKDPLVNAEAAKSVLESQGLGAWYASPSGPPGKVDKQLAERMRALMGGGKVDPDQIPVHGRTKLSYEDKVAKLEGQAARAETTAKLKDDRRAAAKQLELLRTRKRHLEKQVAKISKQLKGKLKPPERERLLEDRSSILSELSGLPSEASSLIEKLRESGVKEKGLKRFAKGLGIGTFDPNKEKREPPTARDKADLQLARAEATADKGDDVIALEKLVSVSEGELKQALKTKDPKVIAEATRNLTEATQNLQEALPTAADFANRDLAMAELTETLDDDRAALITLKSIAEQQLAAALQTTDPRDDIEAAQNLKSVNESIKSLDSTINEQNEILKQQEEFAKERLELDKKFAALAEAQGPAFMAAFLAWVDGAIGGPVQTRGRLATAGVSAGYQ